MTAVPAAAITAAQQAEPDYFVPDDRMAAYLEAAAPHLAADQLTRIHELEQLATDILDTFTPGQDGCRARVGRVQISKWRARLDGQP